jgi:hypothetical protein
MPNTSQYVDDFDTIGPDGMPTAGPSGQELDDEAGSWSLFSLILSLAAVVMTITLMGEMAERRRKYNERGGTEKPRRRGLTLAVFAVASGALIPVAWLVLDDLMSPMVWINRATMYVGALFALHLSMFSVCRNLVEEARAGRDKPAAE